MFIEIKNLSIDLGEFKLTDFNLSVKKGEFIVIIGPTGSGKSVVLESIAGFYKPKEGKIFINGKDVTHIPPEKRGISIVYQDYMLFPHMSVYKNIAYGIKKKIKDKQRIDEEVKKIAEKLGIKHLLHRLPSTLSGGEAQRVAIARAIVVKPKLLLMDEPLSALDINTKNEVRKLIKKLTKKYEITTLHVTHDLEDVSLLADKVVVIKNGRLLKVKTPDKLDRISF